MKTFTLYPAIDLRHGQVVRLRNGDPTQQTVYSTDPGEMAQSWLAQGADWLHVVNLDAALEEEAAANQAALKSILRVARNAGAKVQYGGGLRSIGNISWALEQGVDRVILGTAAALQPELVQQAVEAWGAEHIATGIDARGGKVSVRGWVMDTPLEAPAVAQNLAKLGVHTLIYTDIARDGTGHGGNMAATVALARSSGLAVIASGGFSLQEELVAARDSGLAGVILGRAIYDGQLNLGDCLKILARKE